MNSTEQPYLGKVTHAASLAYFRICFGALMLFSLLRFYLNAWIEKVYIEPTFFFSYYGFEWVTPLGNYTYLLFIICGIASLGIIFGYRYRLSAIVFFLSFTYIELMDKTTYLNHYYFVSLVGFMMIFLPAHRYFSIDAHRNPMLRAAYIPRWTTDSIKLMLGIVYFYAGLAKLNPDWLLNAMPLKIWLTSAYDLPLLGHWLQQNWLHYAFSWGGALYDLAIVFLLLYKMTRTVAFVLVVGFHLMTSALFPIGMFPYMMIVLTTIFFESKWHHSILKKIASCFKINFDRFDNGKTFVLQKNMKRMTIIVFIVFFALQFTLPFRYLLYPDNLFWTEEGFRYSWRVMLMEKAGSTNLKVLNKQTGKMLHVNNANFLTPYQEKQMSFQPDFILQYAHHIDKHYSEKWGHDDVAVFTDSFVALNGRRSRRYIDPKVDLSEQKESFAHKTWILPYDDQPTKH